MKMRVRTAVLSLMMALGLTLELSAQAPLFQDSFNESVIQRPERWKVWGDMPSSGLHYVVSNGEFYTGNGDDLISESGFTYATVDAAIGGAWTDYAVDVYFRGAQYNGEIRIVGRFQDSDNHYAAYFNISNSIDTGRRRKAGIERVLEGQRTLLGKEIVDGVNGVSIPKIEGMRERNERRHARLVFNGSTIALFLDDEQLVAVEDDALESGTAGVGQRWNEVFFSEFRIFPSRPDDIKMAGKPGEIMPAMTRAAQAEPPVFYWVNMGDGLSQAEAEAMISDLIDQGIFNGRAVQENGQWQVVTGAFFSSEAAERSQVFLKDRGLSPKGVIQTKVELAANEKETLYEYRIVSGTYNDPATAGLLKDALLNEGFGTARIVTEGGAHAVVVGPYPTQRSAYSALERMRAGGFTGMTTSRRELVRISSDIKDMASGDIERIIAASVSRLDEKERDDMEAVIRSVVSTVMKEQDARTVEELKAIREKLAAMENQQGLVEQLNQNIANEKKRQGKIAGLLSMVGEAVDLKNWEKAETALKDLESFDPNNPLIDVKRQSISMGKARIDDLGAWINEQFDALRSQVQLLSIQSVADVESALTLAAQLEQAGETIPERLGQALLQYESIRATANAMLGKAGSDPALQAALREALTVAQSKIQMLDGRYRTYLAANQDRMAHLDRVVSEQAESRRMSQYVLIAVVALFVLMAGVIYFLMKQNRRHREILDLVSEIPNRPAVAFAEERGSLESTSQPKALTAAAGVGAAGALDLMADNMEEPEPDFEDSSTEEPSKSPEKTASEPDEMDQTLDDWDSDTVSLGLEDSESSPIAMPDMTSESNDIEETTPDRLDGDVGLDMDFSMEEPMEEEEEEEKTRPVDDVAEEKSEAESFEMGGLDLDGFSLEESSPELEEESVEASSESESQEPQSGSALGGIDSDPLEEPDMDMFDLGLDDMGAEPVTDAEAPESSTAAVEPKTAAVEDETPLMDAPSGEDFDLGGDFDFGGLDFDNLTPDDGESSKAEATESAPEPVSEPEPKPETVAEADAPADLDDLDLGLDLGPMFADVEEKPKVSMPAPAPKAEPEDLSGIEDVSGDELLDLSDILGDVGGDASGDDEPVAPPDVNGTPKAPASTEAASTDDSDNPLASSDAETQVMSPQEMDIFRSEAEEKSEESDPMSADDIFDLGDMDFDLSDTETDKTE